MLIGAPLSDLITIEAANIWFPHNIMRISLRLRKSLPQMLPASIVIRSESDTQIINPKC